MHDHADRNCLAVANSHESHWPHAPLHKLAAGGTYFVTAGTYGKVHYFRNESQLDSLQQSLLQLAEQHQWQLEAWAVFSNHYHFVAHSPPLSVDATSLAVLLGRLHEITAKWINRLDNKPGRKVWHNFYDTQLTFEKSYLARLNYVHQNAVKHGLVTVANQYPWCSAAWFETTARPAQIKTIYSFKLDKVKVYDDYEVMLEARR